MKLKYIFLFFFIQLYSQKEHKIVLVLNQSKFETILPNNCKVATGFYDKDGVFFQVNLIDTNYDAVFNGSKDLIVIEHKKTNKIRFHLGVSSTNVLKKNIIEVNNVFFEITKIDPKGKYIVISKSNKKISTIKLVDRLPSITFKAIGDRELLFSEFSNEDKFTFVEFWGAWCAGCLHVLPNIQQTYNRYRDDLNVIYLNTRDTQESVVDFVKENNLQWINGYASEKIEKELLLNGYPYGVLFDKKGKVIKFNCTYEELENFMVNQALPQ